MLCAILFRFVLIFVFLCRSPHTVDFHGTNIECDMRINNNTELDNAHTKCMAEINGRTFDLGGKIPTGDGPVYIIASHDESCAKAGEFETRLWQHKDSKKICKDKTDGPSLHLASFSVEYGNGKITTDPTNPNPPPLISIKDMRKYIKEKRDRKNPPLPKTADAWMNPGNGEGKDGYWSSAEFWMQTELAMDIFEHVWLVFVVLVSPSCLLLQVFGAQSRFKLVACVDWSQGHAATDPTGLNAEKMLVGGWGLTAKHIRPTRYVSNPPIYCRLVCD